MKKNHSILTITLSLFIASVFFSFASKVQHHHLFWIDQKGLSVANQIGDGFTHSCFLLFTYIGSATGIITMLLLTGTWLIWRKRDIFGTIFLFASTGFGEILNGLLKSWIKRPRPEINPDIFAVGYSFPSGHAMAAMIFFGTAAYVINRHIQNQIVKRWIILISGLFILFIGVSRIVLKAHYVTDVFCGYLAGAAWVMLLSVLFQKFMASRARKHLSNN